MESPRWPLPILQSQNRGRFRRAVRRLGRATVAREFGGDRVGFCRGSRLLLLNGRDVNSVPYSNGRRKGPNPPPPWTGYAVASAQRSTPNAQRLESKVNRQWRVVVLALSPGASRWPKKWPASRKITPAVPHNAECKSQNCVADIFSSSPPMVPTRL